MGREKEKEPTTRRRPGRVPTSCAECRRLKLRCDRNVPCEKCVSRGCGSICPDGSLTTGKGNRMVLANTEELHDRIESLSTRIRELEDALRTLQESVSSSPHPLLVPQDGLRSSLIQNPVSTRAPNRITRPSNIEEGTSKLPDEEVDEVDSFGTLRIGSYGEITYMGGTARTEYLIRARSGAGNMTNMVELPRLSTRILQAGCLDAETVDVDLGREIFDFLPQLSEAVRLCEIYLEHGKYMYTPLQRTELLDETLAIIYRSESFDTLRSHQSLSLLFIIFAIAALFDNENHPYSAEAHEYFCLSRICLSFCPPIRRPTLMSVQILMHMAHYLQLHDQEPFDSNLAWMYIGHAVRLSHVIGLHTNGPRWELPSELSHRRSNVFWQLFVLDTWTSFYFGRPPNILAAYIGCDFPVGLNAPGNTKEIEFHLWIQKYTVLVHTVITTVFGSRASPYSTILNHDRKIRDFYVPLQLQPDCTKEEPKQPQSVYIHRWLTLSVKEWTLLKLHQPYFARALRDRPEDLAQHRYTPSVVAAYRSAWRIIRALQITWTRVPQYLARDNLPWSIALSAGVVMCSLISRAPTSKMAPSAFDELSSLSNFFQEASLTCRSAAQNLEVVQSLCRQAHEMLSSPETGNITMLLSEVDRLGGETRLISHIDTSASAVPYTTPPSELFADVMNSYSITSPGDEGIHPTLAQDMRNFDNPAALTMINDFPFISATPITQREPPPQYVQNVQIVDHVYEPHLGQMQMSYSTPAMSVNPPALDSTWQNFVEQLGF
ncbi:fungal-specific transcription factor domain-containing protein [Infundibulicybe gibba]|nr:fungal-specific transcription factor domain-containing protein [Infundibulicybe gibba]